MIVDSRPYVDDVTPTEYTIYAEGGDDSLLVNVGERTNVAGSRKFARLIRDEQFEAVIAVNLRGVFHGARAVVPHMIERGCGDIIVTSSLAAHYPTPWEPVYASSKWAINCFVQTTRRQVFKHGIRVGSVSPGPVITSLLADWPEYDEDVDDEE